MNAGYLEEKLEEESTGLSFPMVVMYPTDSSEQEERIGPYLLEVAKGAILREGKYPLVLISHGTGGSPLVYRTLARQIASHGYIVGLPEHPFNNRNDNRWEGTLANLQNRPRLLQSAIDWFYKHKLFGQHLKPDSVSVIGHSLGGYTGLAAAGGIPTSFPHESPDGRSRKMDMGQDPRIKSLVLLAPATVWFREEGALRGINLPILMLDAEKDPYTPSFHAEIVLNGVADKSKVYYQTVKNAGHFSFLSPFPESMQTPSFLPAQDPPGLTASSFMRDLPSKSNSF